MYSRARTAKEFPRRLIGLLYLYKLSTNSVLQSTAGPELVEMQGMLLEVIRVQSGVSINWNRLARYHKPVGIYSACKPTKLPQV